jgi:hypothetical protein
LHNANNAAQADRNEVVPELTAGARREQRMDNAVLRLPKALGRSSLAPVRAYGRALEVSYGLGKKFGTTLKKKS